MRFLAHFPTITKIFILFNLLSISNSFNHHHRHYHHHRHDNHNSLSDGYNSNNNNQAIPYSLKSSSTGEKKDNIASTLPQSFDRITDEVVIRNGKLEEPSHSSGAISLFEDRNLNSNLQYNNQERDGLYRRHSSPRTFSSYSASSVDDNIVESTPLYLKKLNALDSGSKTNSLIEWASEKQSNLNKGTTQYEQHQQYHHYNKTNHNVKTRHDGTNTSSTLLNPNRVEHELVADGHSRWCHKLCDINTPVARYNHLICASNGRFYSSSCELKRYSCRHNIQLFKKPKIYCSKQRPQHINTTDSIDDDRISSILDNTNNTEEVRIVELKRRCNKQELDKMKTHLLSEFNGNLASMFRYFDLNGDNYIEAHELWPRKDIESNKFMYAQVWDDHSTKCPSRKFYIPDHNHHEHEYRLVEDQSKCWFFLDFAFQPKFATNPCSLSHLMLFDLSHPSSKFDWNSFQDAFKSLKEASIFQDQKMIRSHSQLDIILGKSASLHCFDNNSNNLLTTENSDIENNEPIKCLWTRYNLNLAALRDPHIYVGEKQIVDQNGIKNGRNLILYLKDAQLYLSGQFKCTCNFKNSARNFEHIYNVKILGK